jgi:hypothetical protein
MKKQMLWEACPGAFLLQGKEWILGLTASTLRLHRIFCKRLHHSSGKTFKPDKEMVVSGFMKNGLHSLFEQLT